MAPPLAIDEARRLVQSIPYWHHRFHLAPDLETPGAYDPREVFARLELGNLAGKRVLDIGTRDGFFAFECERLGAEVVAVDNAPLDRTGFPIAKRILGSKVEYVTANVYDLVPESLGVFDIVLFLGVLYHLRHPLLALDRVRGVCKGRLLVESLVCDHSFFTGFAQTQSLEALAPKLRHLPIAEFMPLGAFHRDWTNKWAPNLACLKAMIEDASFQTVRELTWGDRALVEAIAAEDTQRTTRRTQDSGVG